MLQQDATFRTTSMLYVYIIYINDSWVSTDLSVSIKTTTTTTIVYYYKSLYESRCIIVIVISIGIIMIIIITRIIVAAVIITKTGITSRQPRLNPHSCTNTFYKIA